MNIHKVSALGLLAVMMLSLTACDPPSSDEPSSTEQAQLVPASSYNTDPHNGWVIVQEMNDVRNPSDVAARKMEIAKKCDGTTLMYVETVYFDGTATSISVIANSPECK